MTDEYYKLNLAIPIIDHILADIKEEFTGLSAVCGQLIGPVPTILFSQNSTNFDDVISMYRSDLPTPEHFDNELHQWRMHFSLNKFDPVFIFSKTFMIAATIPVTSCECEGSFSAFRRLNTYNWVSMGQERLSSLALLHIHYDKTLNLDEVVNKLTVLHPRRMELQNNVFG